MLQEMRGLPWTKQSEHVCFLITHSQQCDIDLALSRTLMSYVDLPDESRYVSDRIVLCLSRHEAECTAPCGVDLPRGCGWHILAYIGILLDSATFHSSIESARKLL